MFYSVVANRRQPILHKLGRGSARGGGNLSLSLSHLCLFLYLRLYLYLFLYLVFVFLVHVDDLLSISAPATFPRRHCPCDLSNEAAVLSPFPVSSFSPRCTR